MLFWYAFVFFKCIFMCFHFLLFIYFLIFMEGKGKLTLNLRVLFPLNNFAFFLFLLERVMFFSFFDLYASISE